LAGFDPVVGVSYRLAVPRHRALLQQLLKPRAAEFGQCMGEETVQPPSGMAVIDPGLERSVLGVLDV
jgi:hypothetical protein